MKKISQNELIETLQKALSYREDLIDKYSKVCDKKTQENELKWCDYLRNKLNKGWTPLEDEVTAEVQNTISLGLKLRRNSLESTNPAVKSIEVHGQSVVINVDFKNKEK